MIKSFFKFIIFIILQIIIFNEAISGSFYNSKGFGEIKYFTNAQTIGLGGSAISFEDSYHINLFNPAALVAMKYTRLSGDLINESIWSKSNIDKGFTRYTNLNGISVAIPILQEKLVTAFALQPLSQFDYEYSSPGVINDYEYNKIISATGGLNKLTFGFGYAIHPKIYLGGSFNYNFGKFEQTWKVNFDSDLFWDASDQMIRKLWGISWSGGLIVKPVNNLSIGAIMHGSSNLTYQNHIQYTTNKGTSTYYAYSNSEDEMKVKLPALWGLGTSYLLKNRLRASIEYLHQSWSSVTNYFNGDYNDTYRLSMGLELLPSKELLSKYRQKITYRVGYFIQNLNYKDKNGNDVSEYGITAGIGLPYYFEIGRIDLALRYGQRGDLSNNPVKENIFQVYISVSGGEKWFIRRKQ